ncbi:MAG: 2-oxoglutarate and iron-dependent oxygenase domain-containing protein [Pseudomonadota bacterium]
MNPTALTAAALADATAQSKPVQSLPVIDIGGFGEGNEMHDGAIATALRSACEDKGFFYVVGHGISPEIIATLRTQSETFFSKTLEEKEAVSKDMSPCNRGYERLAAQTLEKGAPPDQKEGYYIGVEVAEDDPRVLAGKFNHGPNQWPDGAPAFREAADCYFAAMVIFGTRLMEAMALSLDLPRDYFSGFTTDPMCTLRLLHYPPQRPNADPDEKGCGAHTDFGGLTLLWQDEVGGLEVFDEDGWIPAPPIEGAFNVNLGDMIQRWTNGRYRSTLHRVINRSGRERYSIPFFYTGNPDHTVRCIETCLEPGTEPLYPPITVSEHLQAMYKQTYI